MACAIVASAAKDFSQGLPLPAVPDSLRTPAARADYVIEHFWDEMDFSDTKYSLNDIFMEQTFANYAQIMGFATPGAGLQANVDRLLEKSSVRKDARQLLCSIARIYLFEPESPVANEELYLYFIQAQLADSATSDADRTRLEYQKKTILMNRPGTHPADFTFLDRNGNEHSLSDAISGRQTLLMFYCPDCDDCHRAMSHIKKNAVLNGLISKGLLQVLAIADADESDLWQSHSGQVPDCIIDGLDTTGIADQELYDIPFTPTFLLIGSDGNVILKNKPLSLIIDKITSAQSDKQP